jgi:acyl-CoA synthetase (NDP forming)
MTDELQRFFSPRAIAVVGASPKPDALSRRFTSALTRHGYPGRIVPVNPSYAEVEGLPCFPSVAEARRTGEIDLAVLAVAAARVPAALEDCAAAGTHGAIVFSGGFAEAGEEGARAQREVADLARRHGIRLLGPNSPGFVNVVDSVCVLVLGVAYRQPLIRGHVGLVSQSGGVGGLVCERTLDLGVGFSRFVSIGNEADISAGELLRWLAADGETRVAALYLEGIRDPQDLVAGLAALARAGKPIVVLKPDSTEAVSRVSAAHTGVLATSDDVFDAVLRHHGATRARTVEEVVDAVVVLDRLGRAAGRRVGLLSASGGAAVLATQAADRAKLELPPPEERTRDALAHVLPGFASVGNPADLTGAFVENRDVFGSCLRIFGDDPQYDAVVVIQTVHPPELAERLAGDLVDFGVGAQRLPVVLWIAGEMSAAARARLRAAGFVVFEDADRCMRALTARANRPLDVPARAPHGSQLVLDDLPAGQLPDDRAFALLAEHGLPIPPMRLCDSARAAAQALADLGGPVAVKAIGLAHKAREGGLVLDVTTPEDAEAAHARVTAAARAGGDTTRSLVQGQVPRGLELIVGARREPGFGSVLMVSLGGSAVELSCVVARRLLPLAAGAAAEMLREAALWDVLEQTGVSAPGQVVATIEQLADLAECFGDRLDAIEVNPLVVQLGGEGVSAVDVLILLGEPGSTGAEGGVSAPARNEER